MRFCSKFNSIDFDWGNKRSNKELRFSGVWCLVVVVVGRPWRGSHAFTRWISTYAARAEKQKEGKQRNLCQPAKSHNERGGRSRKESRFNRESIKFNVIRESWGWKKEGLSPTPALSLTPSSSSSFLLILQFAYSRRKMQFLLLMIRILCRILVWRELFQIKYFPRNLSNNFRRITWQNWIHCTFPPYRFSFTEGKWVSERQSVGWSLMSLERVVWLHYNCNVF